MTTFNYLTDCQPSTAPMPETLAALDTSLTVSEPSPQLLVPESPALLIVEYKVADQEHARSIEDTCACVKFWEGEMDAAQKADNPLRMFDAMAQLAISLDKLDGLTGVDTR